MPKSHITHTGNEAGQAQTLQFASHNADASEPAAITTTDAQIATITNAPPLHELHASASSIPKPLFMSNNQRRRSNMPPWIRPFWSLRTQLALVYSLLLCLVVVILCVLFSQGMALLNLVIAALLLTILGVIVVFFITSLLLHPLQKVTDAAQAIALGDLKQQERLTLRTPPQDEVDRLAGSLHEMVRRLERAEELQHSSERSFRRFFSDASHQLRTPLTSIRGFTEILIRSLKDEREDPETTQHVLQRMKGEAERMTYLINDLLTLARLDDKHPLRIRYVDLTLLANERIKRLQMQVEDERQITLSLLTQERLGLQADEDAIKQLLYVLLDNALKYGCVGPEGFITLELDKRDSNVLIRVIDNGEGIDADDLNHIFDAFYRGHARRNSNKTSGATVIGTGLGLTIADTIVRAHRGTIQVESNAGQGTTFTVILPCEQ